MSEIDGKTFWQLMGARPVGVPVVAASGPEGPAGLLALSVTHVSAAPPTMLVCVGHSTSALAAILSSGFFSINYLAEGADETADIFGGRKGLSGADRFVAGQWNAGETGAPVFGSAAAVFECAVSASHAHEATEIIVGTIKAWRVADQASPMIAYRGEYRGLRSVAARRVPG